MHNNIMAAGSRDRPPMLATGRYAQWRSRFLRYIDTRPNGDALRKCILKGPYTPTIVTTPAVPAIEDSPAVPEQTTVETVTNMTPENRAHFESEKEAIHLILTGIGDEIYSTVDACQTTQEMWEGKAIEGLQQDLMQLQDTRQEIAINQITPPSESTLQEDCVLKELRRIKTCLKNLGSHCKVLQETIQHLPTTTSDFLKHQKLECGNYSRWSGVQLSGICVLTAKNLVIMLRNAESNRYWQGFRRCGDSNADAGQTLSIRTGKYVDTKLINLSVVRQKPNAQRIPNPSVLRNNFIKANLSMAKASTTQAWLWHAKTFHLNFRLHNLLL
ncbi:hypothetical protein Tco_0562233 [Tanacetum coccineum]